MPKLQLVVYRNGDDAHLVWQWPSATKIPDCRGFAVYRKLNGAKKPEAIPSYAGFSDEKWTRGASNPSTFWPVQKFMWTDYTVKSGDTVQYQVVPMVGPRGSLQPENQLASQWSPTYKMDAQITRNFACYFNRGIVATQWVQKMLGTDQGVRARAAKLDKVVEDYKNPKQRNALAGELRVGLLDLLKQAKTNKVNVYAALFELADQELLNALAGLGKRAYVVLADGALSKPSKKKKPVDNDVPAKTSATDENHAARQALKSKVTLVNRMTKGKFLAHNKIFVVCEENGTPRWTWTGSTNWTPSGLCTQANNGILIDDKNIAARFRDQIKLLGEKDGLTKAGLQNLLAKNAKPSRFENDDVTVWFSRTSKLADIKECSDLIANASDMVLFLMFQTGLKNSLLEAILKRQSDDKMYIHGVISTMPPTGGQKKGTGPKKKPTHAETVAKQIAFVHKGERKMYAPDLLLPFAIEKKLGGWFDEFVKKNGAHAIVHSKIVVLDPFGSHPTVITGSHNMGKTASSANDENLVIIKGNADLAAAYAVNVVSIYDNFRWRYRVAAGSKWKGIDNNDKWQDQYLMDGNNKDEIDLWMGKSPKKARVAGAGSPH